MWRDERNGDVMRGDFNERGMQWKEKGRKNAGKKIHKERVVRRYNHMYTDILIFRLNRDWFKSAGQNKVPLLLYYYSLFIGQEQDSRNIQFENLFLVTSQA